MDNFLKNFHVLMLKKLINFLKTIYLNNGLQY